MMNQSIIQEKLKEYNVSTIEQEKNAIKEIIQEVILYGLSTMAFFDNALFQGGTALRILYGLKRFSEDLDFILKKPDQNFNWKKYIDGIRTICEEYGIIADISDKSKNTVAIQKLFIKNDSIGKVIDLSFKNHSHSKITIKLEIDTNPPLGSTTEIKYLDFPLIHAVAAQDLASNFASKCHALLCRPYIKGRDWYDFLWYVSKNVTPNLILLQNALYQMGPWKNKKIDVTHRWFIEKLKQRIMTINWEDAKADVERFLNERDRQQLSLWQSDLFLDRAMKLEEYMTTQN